jgi:lysophospholipase L1-like esterase
VLVAKPWGWYGHNGVDLDAGPGWDAEPVGPARSDGLFGLGGVSFTSRTATATISTAASGPGSTATAFEVAYLARPQGGSFDVDLDGAPQGRVTTAASDVAPGFARFDAPAGAHALTLRCAGDGDVRLFGVTVENGSLGVEYDSLGVNGAYAGLLANAFDERHWAAQLRHRAPDLVILAYGTNESQYEKLPMDQYERDLREAVRRVRDALPNASIMLVGPMDRATRGPGGSLVTRPMIPKLVAHQRRVAAETGCAFFDTYTAMGGDGTAARWYAARPRLMGGDFTHPTTQGAEIVGSLLYDAMSRAYDARAPQPSREIASRGDR